MIGLEVHVHLATRIKLFCPCAGRATATSRTANTCPVVPGAARRAAGAERERGRARSPRGGRHPLPGAPALGLRAQELLLPRPAEGLPDLAVRGAARDGRLARDRPGRSGASRAAIGLTRIHMEEDAGQVDPRRDVACATARTSTSTAPACRCSRSCRSPSCARPEEAGAYLRALRAILRCGRRVGRRHGEGPVPLRRQRLAPAARASRIGTRTETEEPEQLPLRRRGRCAAEIARQAGAARGRRPRASGDAPLRPRDRAHRA